MRNRTFPIVLSLLSPVLVLAMVSTAPAKWGDRILAEEEQPEEIGFVIQREGNLAPAPSPSDLPIPTITCNERCIDYIYRKWHKCRWECQPTMQMVMRVTDPCSGTCCTPPCSVDIPVCLPCCCTGAPTVDCRCGPLGRGVVIYEWCCGYKVKVVFHICGDITVVSNAL